MREIQDDDVFDHNDPDMPVTLCGFNAETGKRVTLVCPPEEHQINCQMALRFSGAPHWSKDPSYNWGKKK